MLDWSSLNEKIIRCRRCPRLIGHCRKIAQEKKRAYRDCEYWGRPVPNFGAEKPALLIVGLAPAAHGANRTGRMFTGDRSGDWLYRALHRAGFANQAEASGPDDGLQLKNCAVTAACHCAPPGNKPNRDEMLACRQWFEKTVDISSAKVYLALGQIAWKALTDLAIAREWLKNGRPKFGHGAEKKMPGHGWLLASYHPSQQNTFTGRLTEKMLDDVFSRARQLLNK